MYLGIEVFKTSIIIHKARLDLNLFHFEGLNKHLFHAFKNLQGNSSNKIFYLDGSHQAQILNLALECLPVHALFQLNVYEQDNLGLNRNFACFK